MPESKKKITEERQTIGYKTCPVCGNEIALRAENHYIARDDVECGVSTAIRSVEPQTFDAMDCIFCGCQLILQPRKRLCEPPAPIYGCLGCAHETEFDCDICKLCSRNYDDKFGEGE